MADILPFQGIHYDRRQVKNLDKVICPPYDVISPELQEELYRRSDFNFVRIEFTRELGGANDKYARAAATLEQWLKQSLLVRDEKPAVYVHNYHFRYQGKSNTRRSLVARVRLEEPGKASIRPHEGTLSQPKSDRLSLLWACQANTSPIFALFEDRDREVASLLSSRRPARRLFSSKNGESHDVWAITEPDAVDRLSGFFKSKPLYIADGHHRYESALTYRREKRSFSPELSGEQPFDFVMMELVDFTDPGLVILPPHRLVHGLPRATLAELRSRLDRFFDIEVIPLNQHNVWQKIDSPTADTEQVKLALLGSDRENVYILTLRDFAAAKQMMPYFHSELYKKLDVSILDHVILEELLELTGDRPGKLDYSYDRKDALERVLSGEYQLAFLIRPIKAELIKAIADAGDLMPKKSTYFYPKVPAGLLVYRLV